MKAPTAIAATLLFLPLVGAHQPPYDSAPAYHSTGDWTMEFEHWHYEEHPEPQDCEGPLDLDIYMNPDQQWIADFTGYVICDDGDPLLPVGPDRPPTQDPKRGCGDGGVPYVVEAALWNDGYCRAEGMDQSVEGNPESGFWIYTDFGQIEIGPVADRCETDVWARVWNPGISVWEIFEGTVYIEEGPCDPPRGDGATLPF